jgi:hypothetical protein
MVMSCPSLPELDEHRADVGDPAQRFEGDVAGVPDDNDALEPARGAVIPAGLAVATDTVVDYEMAALDVQFQSKAATEYSPGRVSAP